ncbi:TIGR04222 domain-containing membrane protein [Streptomyces bohaiensis]|uniref:TIGR04222 domain-containing membrane protein n=1 Tax=Streptomyces bohaiensis TaxID=1431344 RepID=A0ABX1CC87_9ACTN|nr:TIGR04222 domain-containing membrane protein [Streptomyces bohaiensis]NJQ16726.1 TIGR04222 domain-containing membrane protein [Streptomyces bohaiensis]
MAVIWLGYVLVAVVLVTAVRDKVRAAQWGEDPRTAEVRDVYEAAALARGPRAVVDTAICSLHEKQRLRVDGSHLVLEQAVADDAVERAVVDCFGIEWRRRLDHVRSEAASRRGVRDVRRELDERGLLYSAACVRAARTRVVLRLVAGGSVTAAAVLTLAVASPGASTTALGVLIAAAVAAQVVVLALAPPRDGAPTAGGRAALAKARREGVPGRSDRVAEFATGGPAVLAGTALGAALLLPLPGSDDWSPERHADGGSSGGGSGCASVGAGCGGDSGGGGGCGGGCGS